jgi:hypothetical protein
MALLLFRWMIVTIGTQWNADCLRRGPGWCDAIDEKARFHLPLSSDLRRGWRFARCALTGLFNAETRRTQRRAIRLAAAFNGERMGSPAVRAQRVPRVLAAG